MRTTVLGTEGQGSASLPSPTRLSTLPSAPLQTPSRPLSPALGLQAQATSPARQAPWSHVQDQGKPKRRCILAPHECVYLGISLCPNLRVQQPALAHCSHPASLHLGPPSDKRAFVFVFSVNCCQRCRKCQRQMDRLVLKFLSRRRRWCVPPLAPRAPLFWVTVAHCPL